jgi:hypothetical protein
MEQFGSDSNISDCMTEVSILNPSWDTGILTEAS